MLTHLCIGSIYSWSVINEPLMHEVGVVASASSDWTLPMVLPIVSVVLGKENFKNHMSLFFISHFFNRSSWIISSFSRSMAR